MVYLVIGTQNSGKSVLAEKLAMETKDPCRVYLATMKVCDDAAKERVAKHRKQREGKGFVTVEKEYGITDVPGEIDKPGETTLCLECVSNLVGNELYDNQESFGVKELLPSEADAAGKRAEFADRVAAEIKAVADKVSNIILVTNEYEDKNDEFDDETRLYVELLKMVNERISGFSDEIYDLRKERKT